MKQKIYSLNTELYKITGIQRVMIDIHHAVKEDYDSRIVGTLNFDKVASDIGIEKYCYIKLRNPFMFYRSIVIIHERKLLPVFWILNHIFIQRIRLVYIHHNIFYNHKSLSLFPRNIVAISDEGIRNLNGFFKVPINYITKIHNCVRDKHPQKHKIPETDKLTIIYPARVNDVKRQCEIVRNLKGRLNRRIRILFAGEGPQLEELRLLCDGDEQFECLGFRSDVTSLLQQCDFIMLFSLHEGLPIALIEATMCGTPIVCNDVGGNLEIAHNGENAFVTDDWDKLTDILNSLPDISKEEYMRLSRNSREIYERNFTFPRFKNNYLKLIENTLKK